jgi:hypothetical protein
VPSAVRLQFLSALQQQGRLYLDIVIMLPNDCECDRQRVSMRTLASLFQCLITPDACLIEVAKRG